MTRSNSDSSEASYLLPTSVLIGLFGLFLIVSGWAGVLHLSEEDYEQEIARAHNENDFMARAFEEHARRVLKTADTALLFMKDEFEKYRSITPSMLHFAEVTKTDLSAVQVAISDSRGNLIYSAVPLKAPVNISERENFQAHLKRNDAGLFIAKPVKSMVSDAWTFFLSRRIDNPDGSFGGIVSVGIDPFYFGKVYDSISLGNERSGLIVGTDHIVRVRFSRNTKVVGDDISKYSPVFQEASLNPVGHYEVVTTYNSDERLASYRTMPDYPLIVIVSAVKAEALKNYADRKQAYYLAVSLFSLFVGVFCFFLTRADWRTKQNNRRLKEELDERRQAEESLRESKNLFTEFMDHMPAMVCLLDNQGNFLFHNATSKKFYGQDMTGRNIRDLPLSNPALLERLIKGNETALREGPSFSEEKLTDNRGRERVLEFNKFPFIRGDKAPYLGAIAMDVTERKHAERERLAFERKMQQAQKLESLGILAGGIAHDFNNLLLGIVGNIDIALTGVPSDSPLYAALKRAESASQRAAELTNQMLAYSGRGHFVIEPVNLSTLVAEMAPLLSSVHSKRVSVEYRMSDNLPLVEGDATQLRQVVMNLLTNAADSYGEREGVVKVSTGVAKEQEDCYVYVEVSDEGCGIDRETQARIFDPFYTTKHTGRGLGLAAVQGIVRGHKGKIDLRSEPGKGTTFRIYLPGTLSASECAAATPYDNEVSEISPCVGGTVLLVDDEETVRSTAASILELNGYKVITAVDGLEGVEIFRERSSEITVVILDMTMPRMGGADAFREMHSINPAVPVILSSGYSEEDAVSGMNKQGLAGFIQKPYRVRTLLDKVEEILKNPKV